MLNKKCLPTSSNMHRQLAELQRQITWLADHLDVKIPEPPKRYVLLKVLRSDLPADQYEEDEEPEYFAGHITKRNATKIVWTYQTGDAVVYESKADAMSACGIVQNDLEREYEDSVTNERCPYKVKTHLLTDEDDE